MNTKRTLTILFAIALLVVAASLGYLAASSRGSGQLNAAKLVQATQAYTSDLRARGVPVPATVPLQELIQRNLIQESDVSAFQGMDVQINLSADESRPGDVLVRALLPDGSEIVALADGSVQTRSR